MSTTRRLLIAVLDCWPFIALIVLWDLWVLLGGFTATVAPRPWAVLATFVTEPGTYLAPLGWTIFDSFAGLWGGVVLGMLGAFVVHLWAVASGVFTPMALLLRSVPITALIPIVAAVIGYGDGTSIAAIVIIAFFPTFAFALSGMRAASASGKDLLDVLGAGRLTRLGRLELPTALPAIAVALRITTPIAVGGAVLAEMLVGTHGLGRLFADLRAYGQIEQTWGTALLALVLAVLAFAAARAVERVVHHRFS